MVIIKEVTRYEKKARYANEILRALPEWFGIEKSIVNYVKEVQEVPFFVALYADETVGFLAVKIHNEFTAEVFVMGVLKEYHGQKIGKMLLESCEEYCQKRKIEFLTVKTLDDSNTDKNYAKTRGFYLKMGFKPLEVFPLLWDNDNPCLFMAKKI